MAVSFSVGTLDRSVWSLTEPGTPPPDRRVEALRRLTDAGISCGVLVAPVLPGLSDSEAQLCEVVEACAAAGAVSIHGVALHLRGPLRTHYFDWLEGARPDLVRLHRGRFRRGAYQEEAERGRVERIVGEAASRCGVTGRDRYRAAPRATAPVANPPPRPASSCGCSETGRAGRAALLAPYDHGLMPSPGWWTWRAPRRAALGMAALLAACVLVVAPPTGPGAGAGRPRPRPGRPTRPTPSSTPPAG